MAFAWSVAVRFLQEGRAQSLLMMAGAVVGIAVMVFLTALINGLQADLLRQTLGTQAHVVLSEPERQVRPLAGTAAAGDLAVAQVQRAPARLRSVTGWQRVLETVEEAPGVTAVAPVVSGAAFAIRGEAVRSVLLQGVEPDAFDRVIPVGDALEAGEFSVTGSEAVLGTTLARELGVEVGDKLRLEVTGERYGTFTVAGLFDLGLESVNEQWVFVSLRQGQTLLDLAGGVTSLLVTVEEVFEAQRVAGDLARQTRLQAESWMDTNAQLLVALRSQSSSSTMISFFVVVAVALGIASVLSVSVVQKSREIGILKAMGARTGQIVQVFVVQGLIVGLTGAVGGGLAGAGLALFFQNLAANADGSPTFPVDLGPSVWLGGAAISLVTGVLAAVAPARRAARLDPAVVIRHG